MSDLSEVEREHVVNTLLQDGLSQLASCEADRAAAKRVRSIMPALYEKLFDPSARVQRKAAFAICTLRDPTGYAAEGGGAHVAEDKLLADLQRFLAEARAVLFSHVTVTGVEPIGGGRSRFTLVAEVSDRLPMLLDGRRPRVPKPAWVRNDPLLLARVSSSDGSASSTVLEKVEATEAVAAVRFRVEVASDPGIELYIDLVLDRHALDRHLVPLADLVPEPRRPAALP